MFYKIIFPSLAEDDNQSTDSYTKVMTSVPERLVRVEVVHRCNKQMREETW